MLGGELNNKSNIDAFVGDFVSEPTTITTNGTTKTETSSPVATISSNTTTLPLDQVNPFVSHTSAEISTRKRAKLDTKTMVKVALCGGMMAAIRFATAFYPSVELMTLLMVVFALSFGPIQGVAIAVVFSGIESIIYASPWFTFTAFLYWPILAIVLGLAGKIKIPQTLSNKLKVSPTTANDLARCISGILIGILFTSSFAFVSGITGTILGLTPSPFQYYLLSIPYVVSQVLGNIVFLSVLVYPLYLLIRKFNLGGVAKQVEIKELDD